MATTAPNPIPAIAAAFSQEQLLPIVNLFGYCQVASAYGSGQLHQRPARSTAGRENLITNRVNTKEDIYESIKSFFVKGK